MLLGCGLAATWIGCQGDVDSTTPDLDDTGSSTTPAAGDAVVSAYTSVKLKVPNMT